MLPYVSRMWPQVGPMLALCWPYVSPMLAHVGPTLALCWPKLTLCWPKLALCWAKLTLSCPYVGPMFAYVGLRNANPHSSDSKGGGDDGVTTGWEGRHGSITFGYLPKASGKDTGWPTDPRVPTPSPPRGHLAVTSALLALPSHCYGG